MKIIFLDIDGVIKEDKHGEPFLDDSIALLKEITESTGAQIVMSSSWKVKYKAFVDNGYKTDIEDIISLYNVLKKHGLSVSDYTPYLDIDRTIRRPTEIKEYLESRNDIESFCILDDRDEFEWGELSEKLVLTFIERNADGVKVAHLTREHAQMAKRILNGE